MSDEVIKCCRNCRYNTWRIYMLITPFQGGQCGNEKAKAWKEWRPLDYSCSLFVEGELSWRTIYESSPYVPA